MPNLNIYADSMTINREISSYTNVPEMMQNSKVYFHLILVTRHSGRKIDCQVETD